MNSKYLYEIVCEITPKEAELSLNKEFHLIVSEKNIDSATFEIKARLNKGELQIELISSKLLENTTELINTCEIDLAMIFSDIPSFYYSIPFEIKVREIRDPNGILTDFSIMRLPLDQILEYPIDELLLNFKNIKIHQELQWALNSYKYAIKNAQFRPFFCYQAIESLRQYFIGKHHLHPARDKSKSWKILRESLAVPEADLMKLEKLAKRIRHGEIIKYSGPEGIDFMHIAQKCIKNYILFTIKNK